jgi:hypothetical protein
MLKSLERIEKKLENESDSSKIESHRTLERKRRSRVSVDIIIAP